MKQQLIKGGGAITCEFHTPCPALVQLYTFSVMPPFSGMPLISCEGSILLLLSQQRSNPCLSASNDCVLQTHSGRQVSDGETKLLLWPDGGGGRAGEGKGTAAPYLAMCHYLSPEPRTNGLLNLVLPSK